MRAGAIAAVVAVVAILAAGVFVLRGHRHSPARPLDIGGPFTLEDGDGHEVTERDFRGRWMLVYFGYTHCPDVCPTTLSSLAAALGRLPPGTRHLLAPVFITVDPARDTPAVVGPYAHAFAPDILGLTGTPTKIAQAEREWRVYAARHDEPDGAYSMDHSSILYLMRPDGSFAAIVRADETPQAMAQDIVKGMATQ